MPEPQSSAATTPVRNPWPRWNPNGPHIWRQPDEESLDLYPGLTLDDGRVSGSINIGRSRLPLWAIICTAIHQDWQAVEDGWSPTAHYGFTADDLSAFLYHLLELRGEFGRLLMVLADVERIGDERDDDEFAIDTAPWWQMEDLRARVIEQLERCINVLRKPSPEDGAA